MYKIWYKSNNNDKDIFIIQSEDGTETNVLNRNDTEILLRLGVPMESENGVSLSLDNLDSTVQFIPFSELLKLTVTPQSEDDDIEDEDEDIEYTEEDEDDEYEEEPEDSSFIEEDEYYDDEDDEDEDEDTEEDDEDYYDDEEYYDEDYDDIELRKENKLYNIIDSDEKKLFIMQYYFWNSQRLFTKEINKNDCSTDSVLTDKEKRIKEEMESLKAKDGVYVYAGMLDTARISHSGVNRHTGLYESSFHCSRGHALRYLHFAYNVNNNKNEIKKTPEEIVSEILSETYKNTASFVEKLYNDQNMLVFGGSACIFDFFNFRKEDRKDCLRTLSNIQIKTAQDMEVMATLIETNKVEEVNNSLSFMRELVEEAHKIDMGDILNNDLDDLSDLDDLDDLDNSNTTVALTNKQNNDLFKELIPSKVYHFFTEFLNRNLPVPKSLVQEVRCYLCSWITDYSRPFIHYSKGNLKRIDLSFIKQLIQKKYPNNDYDNLFNTLDRNTYSLRNGYKQSYVSTRNKLNWNTLYSYLQVVLAYESCGKYKYNPRGIEKLSYEYFRQLNGRSPSQDELESAKELVPIYELKSDDEWGKSVRVEEDYNNFYRKSMIDVLGVSIQTLFNIINIFQLCINIESSLYENSDYTIYSNYSGNIITKCLIDVTNQFDNYDSSKSMSNDYNTLFNYLNACKKDYNVLADFSRFETTNEVYNRFVIQLENFKQYLKNVAETDKEKVEKELEEARKQQEQEELKRLEQERLEQELREKERLEEEARIKAEEEEKKKLEEENKRQEEIIKQQNRALGQKVSNLKEMMEFFKTQDLTKVTEKSMDFPKTIVKQLLKSNYEPKGKQVQYVVKLFKHLTGVDYQVDTPSKTPLTNEETMAINYFIQHPEYANDVISFLDSNTQSRATEDKVRGIAKTMSTTHENSEAQAKYTKAIVEMYESKLKNLNQ